MNTLSDKIAFVTGGSRGIGAGVVHRLAREGADVGFTYHTSDDAADEVVAEVSATGQRALAIQADSADPDALRGAVDRTAAELDGLDILVSSAGTLPFKPVQEFTDDEFDGIVAVNLRASFAASQAAIPHMRRGGRIVIIGSNIAHHAALPTTSLYAMAKSGLVGLAKGMARDLGPLGITVNIVEPGPIETDANPADGPYSDQLKAFMATPQYGSVDDVAGMVAYLASDESGFATGATFTIDNGFTA
jgi:3-oxoacyl-[acyl-carrier protein] reductase